MAIAAEISTCRIGYKHRKNSFLFVRLTHDFIHCISFPPFSQSDGLKSKFITPQLIYLSVTCLIAVFFITFYSIDYFVLDIAMR